MGSSRLMAIAFLFIKATSVSALDVYMQAEGVNLRVAEPTSATAYNYDYLSREQKLKNSSFYLPPGSRLSIPDRYVVRSSNGQPDIQKSVENWYHVGQQSVRTLNINDSGSAVKTQDRKANATGNFMAVDSSELNKLNPDLDLPKKYSEVYVDFQKILKDNPKALVLKQDYVAPAATVAAKDPYAHLSAADRKRLITPIDFSYFDKDPSTPTQAKPVVQAKVEPAKAEPIRTESVQKAAYSTSTPSEQNPMTGSTEKSGLKLVCMRDGQDECKDVHYDLENLPKHHFTRGFCNQRHCDSIGRVRAFAEYMAPIAKYFQAKTGMPASVMIAQAMIETGYGTSFLFNNKEALFGESCGHRGSRRNRDFEIDGVQFVTKGKCLTSRPANEGGYYVEFDSKESSVASYIHNILYDPLMNTKRNYLELRQLIKSVRDKDPNGVAPWQQVIPLLKGYATDSNYFSSLASTVRNFKLDQYDKNSCQTCIQQRENNQRSKNETKATS